MNRLTQEYIESRITHVEYEVKDMEGGPRLTTCYITMVNGALVIGHSFCADASNFVKETGELVSYRNAFDQLWALEGYLLKERLYQESVSD